MSKKHLNILIIGLCTIISQMFFPPGVAAVNKAEYSLIPPFVSSGVPPLVMLVMGRNHKLYYEAYNDASDLNGDGQLDIGYNPEIDYYGYFDSYKAYEYNSIAERFEPVAYIANKKVAAANQWSGDYLNYLTMSRMDCLRKVLYGGYRNVDTTGTTILQRCYVPQDAHSWGKEYESIARDGYDISKYTPLSVPNAGFRHLFASTTLSDNGPPLLRVLPDNTHRIWEWVAKERPVCDNSLESGGSGHPGHPGNHTEYETMVLTYAQPGNLYGSAAPANGRIDGTGNPFGPNYSPYNSGAADQENYLTIFDGIISISHAGSYQFAVDGDDAVEVIIDGTVVAGYYGPHGRCNCTTNSGTISLDVGTHDIEFRHEEAGGGDNYYLHWNGPDSNNGTGGWKIVPAQYSLDSRPSGLDVIQSVYDLNTPSSTITDYKVKVLVAVPGLLETNCKEYPNGDYKPIGLLQRDGESERMMFGLLTGSYTKNTSGGVLRKNIGSINDEIDASTGQFTSVNGIINTINNFRTICFDYGSYSYNCNCGWITTRPINEGECRMWGNPIGEMMYEGLRYFAGKASPTAAYTYSGATDDSTLGLPLPSWNDPYDAATGFDYCAKPFMLVISDINPSYDSDQLPGVDSNFGSFTGDLPGLDVSARANTISTEEGIGGNYYIGQVGATYDGAPTAKTVTTLGNIRGLSPEEPGKEGSYYSASVSYFGRTEDLSAASGDQNVVTYSVGLASPLPRIEIPINGQTITLVPFAKSVGGCLGVVGTQGLYQPTNTIVDFFVEEITPTYGKFRINYEDVEQGADHDMDAIVEYEYTVNADNTVTISLNSTYAAGCIIQHMGYVISGTTADGTYLEVRDFDTGAGSDPDYFLDTPPGQAPGGTWNDSADLPLCTSRTFSPGTTAGATILENPLWYAAKWGGFEEAYGAGNNLPDDPSEWDKDGDDTPDTYFYVTNPLKLEEQLNKSFADILRRTASGTAASVISSSRSGEGAIYQAIFYPEFKGQMGHAVSWVGNVNTYLVDAYGNMREDTNGNHTLDTDADKIIVFDGTTVKKYTDTDGNGKLDDSETTSPVIADITSINFLWSAGNWLNSIYDSDILLQRTYASTAGQRFIFTFVDLDQDMIVDNSTIGNTGELLNFTDTQTAIYPYIHVVPNPFDLVSPPYLSGIFENGIVLDQSAFDTFAANQAKRVIRFIRGQDQGADSSSGTYTIPAMRSRQIDYNNDWNLETWRLGDVVFSTPTIVGSPAEFYDLIYEDSTYTKFRRLYRHRRQMIYVGSNDGILHAFNGGFFDDHLNKFWTSYSTGTHSFSDTGIALGAEMWGYVPYNLLPHLSWQTEADYDTSYHVCLVDLKPRIFDAKIFPSDTDHPYGWGTVMVVGMRFGGGQIAADTDRDNNAVNEPVMKSAYIVMDITNPELPPKPLAELSFPDLGYTTCYPTVIPMKDKESASDNNLWYLVLGSGPAPAVGMSSGSALPEAISSQQGKVYLVDLKKLATDHAVYTIDSSGTLVAGGHQFVDLDNNSFISDPITIDYNLDYKADTVYFGTVSGSFSSGWGGKLRRLVIDNDDNPTTWVGDSVLIDLDSVHSGQPIVAAPSVTVDNDQNRWIFFGTGRFFNRLDVTNTATASDQQSYYGIKESRTYNAVTSKYNWSWNTVTTGDLLNVSGVEVFEGGNTVLDTNGIVTGTSTNFSGLETGVENADGWYLDFPTSMERNLGQAALLGDLLTFTTYVPSNDPCEMEGFSYLYPLYFKTGTAYKESIIGLSSINSVTEGTETKQEVLKATSLGLGLTMTPNIHVGKAGGSKAFVQTSTGAILGIKEANPGATKSGGIYWREVLQ